MDWGFSRYCDHMWPEVWKKSARKSFLWSTLRRDQRPNPRQARIYEEGHRQLINLKSDVDRVRLIAASDLAALPSEGSWRVPNPLQITCSRGTFFPMADQRRSWVPP